MSAPSIAIVGGGLGGLTLARTLQVHGVHSTVFELDASGHARSQGGSLDIHVESGQRALREAGLYETFLRFVTPSGEATRILDKTGTVFVDEQGEDAGRDRPEIERGDLHDLLVDSLEPGTIVWNHKVTTLTPLDNAQHQLTFADGSSATVDLLIGADGAWSKVRPLVSNARPEYSGVSFLDMSISDLTPYPESAALVGPGIMFAFTGDRGMIAHGGNHIRNYAALQVPEDWLKTCGVNWADAGAARRALLSEYADWSDAFKNLIRNSDDTIIPRPIYALPVGYRWERVPGVTLLGDAAHLMSPFAGEGANLAMQDGTELALALIEHGDDIEAALSQYETVLFSRSEEAALQSAEGVALCFAPHAPRELTEMMTAFGPER